MIVTPYLPHQEEIVAKLKHWHSERGCVKAALFSFLGSGKSLMALGFADTLKPRRILITSDKNNVIDTWPDQVYRHTDYDVSVRPTDGKEIFGWPNTLCVIVNYEHLRRNLWLLEVPFDVWIGDESSEFKNNKTHRWKDLRYVTASTQNRIILNGKAMTEDMLDLYAQLVFLEREDVIGHTRWSFIKKYMMPDPLGYGYVPKPSAFTELRQGLEDHIVWLQEEDTDVQMPTPRYVTVPVEMTPEQSSMDTILREEFSLVLGDKEMWMEFAPVIFQKRLQLCGGFVYDEGKYSYKVPTDKLNKLLKICQLNPDSKIAVWHQYREETNILAQTLGLSGIPCVDGMKEGGLEEFRQLEQGVLLVRLSKCKGLNQLADVDIAVYYSNHPSYRIRSQSEGRSRRISSTTEQTTYVDLITEGGADTHIFNALTQKRNFSLTLENASTML